MRERGEHSVKKLKWAEIISKRVIRVFFGKPIKLGESLKMKLLLENEPVTFVAAMKSYISHEVDLILKSDLTEDDINKDFFLVHMEEKIRVVPTTILDEFAPTEDIPLGAIYSETHTIFRTWSPVAKSVNLLLFDSPESEQFKKIPMKKLENGLWEAEIEGDLDGKYYLYEIERFGEKVKTVDIYSKSVAINGSMSAIVDLSKAEPPGWKEDKPVRLKSPTDAIIYEMHIADISGLDSSSIDENFRAKYLGVVQEGEHNGVKTVLAHLKEFGITHVQIMPTMIFRSCDEADQSCYNWGYDPYLYMVPSGKYSSNPWDPYARIRELREMIMKLHANGIGVILDIVFPHTFDIGEKSPFDATVPYYYYRLNQDGSYKDETGCGNTVATERKMVKKLMKDTVSYWLEEFHVDGFRFDQMGVIDENTMEEVTQVIKKINPNALVYGEPWGGGGEVRIFKGKQKGKDYGVFNDEIRDAIRGSVFDVEKRGFVLAGEGQEKRLAISLMGSPQYLGGFTEFPSETVNYAECHDNHTLFDKNYLAAKLDVSEEWSLEDLKRAQKLAAGILLTSIGIPFLQLGQDFCRTKKFHPNSYNASLEINGIDWKRKKEFYDVFLYHKGLIELRKKHPAFRAFDPNEIRNKVKILKVEKLFIVMYYGEHLNNDPWKHIILLYNGSRELKNYHLPQGVWNMVVNENTAGIDTIEEISGLLEIPPISMMVLWG